MRFRILISLPSVLLLLSGCGSTSVTGKPASSFEPRRYTHQPLTGGSGNPHECRSYFGADVGAVICNQHQLEGAWVKHRLLDPNALHVAVEGRSKLSSAGENHGLVQVLLTQGWPFEPNSKLILSGTAPSGTIALVSARDLSAGLEHEKIMQAMFSDLGLAHGGHATITIRRQQRRITISLIRPDGRQVAPDLAYQPHAATD